MTTRLLDYPPHLRGFTQNKWKGFRTQKLRVFRGSTFGPASSCYTYTEAQKKQVEEQLREEGRL